MPKRLLLLTLLTIITATGCSKAKVAYRYIQPTDLALFTTYSWQGKTIQNISNNLDRGSEHRLVQNTVDSLFSEKGYSLSPDPDFIVSYQYSTRARQRNIMSKIGIGIGSFGRYCGVESSRWPKNQKHEGLLVIKMMDAKKGNIFWKATIKGAFISNNSTTNVKNDYVKRMVEQILYEFPSTNKKDQTTATFNNKSSSSAGQQIRLSHRTAKVYQRPDRSDNKPYLVNIL